MDITKLQLTPKNLNTDPHYKINEPWPGQAASYSTADAEMSTSHSAWTILTDNSSSLHRVKKDTDFQKKQDLLQLNCNIFIQKPSDLSLPFLFCFFIP